MVSAMLFFCKILGRTRRHKGIVWFSKSEETAMGNSFPPLPIAKQSIPPAKGIRAALDTPN